MFKIIHEVKYALAMIVLSTESNSNKCQTSKFMLSSMVRSVAIW